MVHAQWMEQKIIKLENDLCDEFWSDLRRKQLNYLLEIYRTGKFAHCSTDQIDIKLQNIYNGQDEV